MKIKQIVIVVFISIFTAGFTFVYLHKTQKEYIGNYYQKNMLNAKNVKTISNAGLPSFTDAAALTTPAVVHVKSSFEINTNNSRTFYGDDVFEWFFGNKRQGYNQSPRKQTISTGSGVVVSADGYIVTNNHVIDKANSIEITLSNNKKYKANLIGNDKDTDLAVLKIEEKGLPFLNFANSDNVLVGEWVLAVGNPFNLSSTVTAGIVSAKGRNINLLKNYDPNSRSNTAIEAFIQTDAAVNPGNSGGALVNTKGELIGINTAIATPTGTFAGYSFAVPSNLVSKVVDDIIEFGNAQRVFLGVNIKNVTNKMAYELQLDNMNGVFIADVIDSGYAFKSGIKVGDVIVSLDNKIISKSSELQEKMAEFSPGDQVKIALIRKGELLTILVKLY